MSTALDFEFSDDEPREPLSHEEAGDLYEGAVAQAVHRLCAATVAATRREWAVMLNVDPARADRLAVRRQKARIARRFFRQEMAHYLTQLHERTTEARYAEVLAKAHRRCREAETRALGEFRSMALAN